VKPYIEHRMNRAGWQGNPSFDPAIFPALHEATGGIPRRINQVVSRLLLLGAVEQRTHIDAAMLAQVLGEFNDDGTITIVSPQPEAQAEPAPQSTTFAPAREPEPAREAMVAAAAIEAAIAERDAQIQELQQAVIELANAAEEREEAQRATHAELSAALAKQIAAMEARLSEQDRTIRHALTMIIEWVESGDEPRAAA
jgi:general secretion pathway protein A